MYPRLSSCAAMLLLLWWLHLFNAQELLIVTSALSVSWFALFVRAVIFYCLCESFEFV